MIASPSNAIKKSGPAIWAIPLVIVILAVLWRAWIIESEALKLNSDEAVVGLMARHMANGQPVPTFYYGQDYMGSLDAVLIAGGFILLGESVTTIRVVQAALYLISLGLAYGLAYRVTGRRRVAWMTCLLLAIPTMLGTLYSGITLGGYNELIILGVLVIWQGWEVTYGQSKALWRWGLLGLAAGLGWWTNGAIITPLAVVGLWGVWHFSAHRWRGYALAMGLFLLGSAPWWVYNLNHDWAALAFLTSNDPSTSQHTLTWAEKSLALILVGFSSLYGFRFPWDARFQSGLSVILAGIVYLALLSLWLQERLGRHQAWLWRGQGVVLANFGVLSAVFMFSSFQDATGRYLMPLWIPATLGIALALERLRCFSPRLASISLAILVAFHALTTLPAIQHPSGIQAQLDSALITQDSDDQAMIAYLDAQGYRYGYTSYWVSYKLIFLTQERLIFDTSLPYDTEGYRPNNNRYAPYVEQVAQAETVVWITQAMPELDRLIEEAFQEAQISYQVEVIGPYWVYHRLSRPVAPAEFGFTDPALFTTP